MSSRHKKSKSSWHRSKVVEVWNGDKCSDQLKNCSSYPESVYFICDSRFVLCMFLSKLRKIHIFQNLSQFENFIWDHWSISKRITEEKQQNINHFYKFTIFFDERKQKSIYSSSMHIRYVSCVLPTASYLFSKRVNNTYTICNSQFSFHIAHHFQFTTIKCIFWTINEIMQILKFLHSTFFMLSTKSHCFSNECIGY